MRHCRRPPIPQIFHGARLQFAEPSIIHDVEIAHDLSCPVKLKRQEAHLARVLVHQQLDVAKSSHLPIVPTTKHCGTL